MQKKQENYAMVVPSYPTNNVFDFEDTKTLSQEYRIPVDRPVRIYCDGIYDLFHYGHALSLKQAKNLFPSVYLLVGIPSDTVTQKLKGKTVLSAVERAESLIHCKYVDEVILDAPWVITLDFIKQHSIDFVAHDDIPYPGPNETEKDKKEENSTNSSSTDTTINQPKINKQENEIPINSYTTDIYAHLKKLNIFVPTKRTKGVSTSAIITRIVSDYDTFVRRNLERGISAKDLNISFLQESKFKMKKKVDKIIQNVDSDLKNEMREIKREIRVVIKYWENMSHKMIRNFLKKFDKKEEKNLWNKIVDIVKR
ncbi:choline-phosphate cytidylyltransferase [Hamiltosporidium tvaerminnensis]|uniref:choline-phosphate cytidylyltransferase n=3 Tax=Hamiltosporidium TaxID=1176354 RepID=A0A4V2JVH5_9MICR|nr:choline-phosphate cytidylyltransferase [Hamiltosporidium tvaerminnensis]TBU09104.1 choline-phosphate cytidylyltransferase [Hamiltosporidium magnivora]TBU13673.1 choline-phosphate cytidylyltransferase [Hamiltosporidium tvaerminnensis]